MTAPPPDNALQEALARCRAAEAEVTRLESLLDLARDLGRVGVWERDVHTLQGHWDEQVCAFWGLDPAQKTPDFQTAISAVVEPDPAEVDRYFRESLAQSGRYGIRFTLRATDGTLHRMHSRWEVKDGPDGRPARVLGLMVDETEPLALAQAALETRSQLELAQELCNIVTWRVDTSTRRVHYNRGGWAAMGRDALPDGLPVDDALAAIHPDDRTKVEVAVRAALAGSQPVDQEVRYLRHDGTWCAALTRRTVQRDASGQPVAILGVALDITEQHHSALALRSAQERVALAAQGAGLGTFEFVHGAGDPIWDDQMWALRGRTPRPWGASKEERQAAVHPDDHPRIAAAMREARVSGAPTDYEFRVVWPDGQVRWLASRSVELRDPVSGARRRIGVNWDVTDRHAADTARHEREMALRASEAKSRFLSRMSHELRTPLNAVLGFSQLLLASGDDADPAAARLRQYALHIHGAGEHLLALINDVLDLSRLEGGEMKLHLRPVKLAQVVSQALALLGTLPQQCDVRVHVHDTDAWAMADDTRLRQALLNLLSNAVKYNRSGGSVHLHCTQQGGRSVLHVRDTGRGMSEQQLAQLFEPFNRLGAEGDGTEGTGIGLAITRSLVRHMGGVLRVSSTPGAGSEFELDLASAPAVAPDATASDGALQADPAEAGERAAVRHPTANVLYIEDNPVNALVMRELLARRGGVVLHVASDGRGGVALADRVRPHLILLDMHLPDIDGFEVLRRLRAHPATAATPCVAVSANAMPEDVARARAAGLLGYWTKPLDFTAVNAELDRLLGAAR